MYDHVFNHDENIHPPVWWGTWGRLQGAEVRKNELLNTEETHKERTWDVIRTENTYAKPVW